MRLIGGRPGDAALVTGEGVCTFGDLDARVKVRVAGLGGVEAPVIVVTASMTIDFVVGLLAALGARRPAAVFSPHWNASERRAALALLGACAEVGRAGEVTVRRDGPVADLHPDTRLILFTTGSTGEPKAVQLSETNIESNTAAVVDAVSFATARAQVLFLPLSYSYGLLGQLLPALRTGVATELVERLVDVADRFARGSAEGMVSGVPSHHAALLRLVPPGSACPRVTHVVSAGAAASPELRRRLRDAFPGAVIYANYGQTEASPRVLCLPSSHPKFFTTATGFPVGRLSVRLGEDGELLVRGPQVMLGYLGDPDGTTRKLAGGWLHTGDLATLDDEGLVTVNGRADDLINVGGERMSLIEVEAALAGVSGVRHAAAVAVTDELYGTAWAAYVEPAGDEVTADQVREGLRLRLPPRKMPASLHLIRELPLTQNGKVDRRALAALSRTPARS